MATSRNDRRRAAKARLLAKSERVARAELGRQADERQAIVDRNMASPPVRNYYPQSCLAGVEGMSHRGYVCRASGGMARRQALALKAKGSWR